MKASTEKTRVYQKRTREKHPGNRELASRKHHLKKTFGLTLAQFDAMQDKQGGVCAICHRPEVASRVNLCVDHHGPTGAVRELFCYACNLALGNAGECPDRLRAMAVYLEKHPHG